jgi:hypothetical protein
MIPNANDRNFKSLLSKLISSVWLEKVIDTPATSNSKRNFEFFWTLKGQVCALTIKRQIKTSPFWNESNSFFDSLNEQEQAFFHAVFLSEIPDQL